MNEPFKVGTTCIGQNFTTRAFRNGMECEIIEGLQSKKSRSVDTGRISVKARYKVRWADGSEFWLIPFHLRRKPPKQSDSQWADEAVRKLKKQSSDHVVIGKPELIPEESVQ